VRPYAAGDRRWAEGLLEETMGGTRVARLGELVDPAGLPGLVAERDGERLGLLTYIVDGDQFEVLSLHCRVENAGAGSALLEAATGLARDRALKPEIPQVNPDNRVPMRDLLELELPLQVGHATAVVQTPHR
jgi:hypothetical protein